MKQQLHRRLAELERISKAQAPANSPDVGESACEKVRQYLHARGIEQGPMESLMETLARAVGITCPELRERLRARALGALP
jgi:hypothetical protein